MILVVDDDAGARSTYQYWLKGAGLEVQVAADGREALNILGASGVGAVLLDIFMPGMEGIETLRHIKRHHPEVRVIIMSGASPGSCDFLQAARKLGADTVLQKPFAPAELLSSIRGEGDASAGA